MHTQARVHTHTILIKVPPSLVSPSSLIFTVATGLSYQVLKPTGSRRDYPVARPQIWEQEDLDSHFAALGKLPFLSGSWFSSLVNGRGLGRQKMVGKGFISHSSHIQLIMTMASWNAVLRCVLRLNVSTGKMQRSMSTVRWRFGGIHASFLSSLQEVTDILTTHKFLDVEKQTARGSHTELTSKQERSKKTPSRTAQWSSQKLFKHPTGNESITLLLHSLCSATYSSHKTAVTHIPDDGPGITLSRSLHFT